MNRQTPMLAADDVRETPPAEFARISKAVGGFTLDACATHANAKCDLYFTERGRFRKAIDPYSELSRAPTCEGDLHGLTGSWAGYRVWCNPPFSGIASWVRKAWSSPGAELVVMVVPSTRREQKWWQDLVEPYRDCNDLRSGVFANPVTKTWRLFTRDEPGRWNFLENGKPIMRKNKDGSQWLDPKTGLPVRSSPKFGVTLLVWAHANETLLSHNPQR
jgi:DNA N-6-adenine-methyltransferase Dam